MQSLPTSDISLDSRIPVVSSAASDLSVPISRAPSGVSGLSFGRNLTLAAAVEIVASRAQLTEMQRQALYSSLDAETSSAVTQTAPPAQGGNMGPGDFTTPPAYW